MYLHFLSLIGCRTLLILGFLALVACSPEAEKKEDKGKKPHLVEIAVAKQVTAGVSRVRTGSLRARHEIKVYSQEEGRVIELPVYEGDRVKQGQVIARLDDALLRAQLSRAQATRKKAEQDLKRSRDLYQRKLTSEEELGRSETELEVAKSDETVLATRLGYTVITAPINGVISSRLTEPGNVIEKHTHLLTLSDPTALVTEVSVSELLMPELKVGDKIKVSIDALGADRYDGRIQRIHPNLDPVTRRGTVEVELNPVPKGARPGQLCRVEFTSADVQRLLIPFLALRRDDEGEYVFVLGDKDKVNRVGVRSGLRIGEVVEIIDGLATGAEVVTRGFLGLTPDKKVKRVNAEKSDSVEQPG